jgi:hypothetical protein
MRKVAATGIELAVDRQQRNEVNEMPAISGDLPL